MLAFDSSIFLLKPKYSYKVFGTTFPTKGTIRLRSPILRLFDKFEGMSAFRLRKNS